MWQLKLWKCFSLKSTEDERERLSVYHPCFWKSTFMAEWMKISLQRKYRGDQG